MTQPATGREPDLLTITEAADLLRAPVATLRYWRHLGTGPRSFRLGRRVLYRRRRPARLDRRPARPGHRQPGEPAVNPPRHHRRTRRDAGGDVRRASAPLSGTLGPCWRTSDGHRATLTAGDR